MKHTNKLHETGGPEGSRGRLAKLFWGPALLAAFAAGAQAGPVGICLLPSVGSGGSVSSANYATAAVTAGCIPGFSTTLVAGGVANPTSLAAGLTTATLQVTQPMTSGGNAVASSGASLDQGVLRDSSNTQGGLVCGAFNNCATSGRAIAESLFGDNIHFAIAGGAASAIVTVNAHLGGNIGFEAGATNTNYNISEQFSLGGNGCWGSATGLASQPCLSGNNSFLTSSFTNQSTTGFDFTGTFQVTNGLTNAFFAALIVDCGGGVLCDFSSTASFSLTLPSNVTFTSDSGVLFSKIGAGAPTPEPATFAVAATALLAMGVRRRRNQKPGP